MNEIDELILAYKAEQTSDLREPDKQSIKDRVVSDLEEYSSEPGVLAFLLEVVVDKNDYDLARIEALNVLHVRQKSSQHESSAIGLIIAKVLLDNEEDSNVKNYAAIAAASYMEISEVHNAVEQIVLDTKINSNLRENAFDAIERWRRNPESVRIVQLLSRDILFGKSAQRVLQDWGIPG